MIITMGLICFLLSYVMFMQFKTVKETNITQIEKMRESELREKLATWKEKYEETQNKLEETKAKLEEYRVKRETNQEASEVLNKELEQALMLAGKTKVKGKGVVITLKDNYEVEDGIITHTLLVDVVNELISAGAEAISINEQRIINMSDIFDIAVGNFESGTQKSYILINTKKGSTSPFTIKAIGNQEELEKTVKFMDRFSKNATLEIKDNVEIPQYEYELQTGHMKEKEEQK